jgi:hypothetical protein
MLMMLTVSVNPSVNKMKAIRLYLYLLFLMLLIIVPLSNKGVNAFSNDQSNADKPQTIYTIQIGSYLTFARAQNEFNSIMEALTKEYCSFLRVERVGSFYTVRLGKFERYSNAENLIKSLPSNMPNVKILKAYLKYDRLLSCICH